MKKIPLTRGQYAIVDNEDYDELSKYKWQAHWSKPMHSFYAARTIHTIRMHRVIMGLERGDRRQVDHINHNTLDNRRCNLRVVTNRQNHENRKDQSSCGIGVRFDCRYLHPYMLQVYANGKNHYLGTYATPEEATDKRTEFLEALAG